MNKNRIFGIAFVVLGVLIMLTPGVISPVCPAMADGKFMKCHWMGQAIKGAGGLMAVLGAVYTAICCNRNMHFALSIANVGLGIFAILLPAKLIGGCKMADMACRAKTIPTLYLLIGIYIVVSLVALFLNRPKHETN